MNESNIYGIEVLEQWLHALIQRQDVCSHYKIRCIVDAINIIMDKETAL